MKAIRLGKDLYKNIRRLCYRFGDTAVKKGFINEGQFKDAMLEQLEDDLNKRRHKLIGAILFEKGWMTWQQVDIVLKELFKKQEG